MTNPEKNNWKAPPKDYEGENIPFFFAIQLLQHVISYYGCKTKKFDIPIASELDEVLKESYAIMDRLKEKGKYFYTPIGSIYKDFKVMENTWLFNIGLSMGANSSNAIEIGFGSLMNRFDPNMSTADALLMAEDIVSRWNW